MPAAMGSWELAFPFVPARGRTLISSFASQLTMTGSDGVKDERIMITPTRVSYAVLAATIVLARFLHLEAPLLVILFSYFALRQLYYVTRRKWLALALFIIGVTGVAAGGVYFTRTAVLALPGVADTSIPSANAWAQKSRIELPWRARGRSELPAQRCKRCQSYHHEPGVQHSWNHRCGEPVFQNRT